MAMGSIYRAQTANLSQPAFKAYKCPTRLTCGRRQLRQGFNRSGHGENVAAEPSETLESSKNNRDRLKVDVIRFANGTARGRKASTATQTKILDTVSALERANPTPQPVGSRQLSGNWSLLYQGPEVVKETGRGEPLEGPLLSFLGLFFGWAFRTRGITQIIDTDAGSIQNLAEFQLLLFLRGSLNIVGTVIPAAVGSGSSQGGDEGATSPTRVDVAFKYALLQLGWLKLKLPLAWANPRGWVETTYLDDTLRIGHGDKGSVFITARRK